MAARPAAHQRALRDLVPRGRPLLRPAAYYVLSRLAVMGAALVATSIIPRLRVIHALGSVWDGRWYLLIAQHGYPHHLFNEGDGSRWAFFPGFPLAVRALAVVTRLSLPDAAFVAAFVFGLTSALAIWLAVRDVFGPRLADRAVLLYVFCPTAYVLSLAYTEGLFLTAAATCLFALSRRYWVTAALCACVAGLTRNAGVVVVLAVLVTALPAAWRGRAWRPALAALVAPLGLVSFMAYGWAMVGTPVAFLSAERFWQGQHFVWFLAPVDALVAALHQGPGGAAFLPDAMAGAALVLGFVGICLLDRMGRAVRTVGGALGGSARQLVGVHGGRAARRLQRVLHRQHPALHHGRLPALRGVRLEAAPLHGGRGGRRYGVPAGRAAGGGAELRRAPHHGAAPPLTGVRRDDGRAGAAVRRPCRPTRTGGRTATATRPGGSAPAARSGRWPTAAAPTGSSSGPTACQGNRRARTPAASRASERKGTPSPRAASAPCTRSSSHAMAANPEGSGEPKGWNPRVSGGCGVDAGRQRPRGRP